jgi:hypothetical protein
MKKNITKNSVLVALLFLISLSIFTGCGGKKPAVGEEHEILVVADSLEYLELKSILTDVFSKVIYTPQPEILFNVKRIKFSEYGKRKSRKNIILAAPLNTGSYVSNHIGSMLDSNVFQLVESGEEFVFNKYDLWAQNQLVMILTAPDMASLKQKISDNRDDLLYYFQKISNKRLFKSLYNAKYERRDIEAKLLNDYGWIIYVQADFLLAKDAPEDNFVWLRRAAHTDMERWIFVHWIENASPSLLNIDSIAAIRNKLTQKYYTNMDNSANVIIADEQAPFDLVVSEVNFNDKYALMTQGFWRFSDHDGGGPFISYSYYDEKTGRVYIIDGSIFAPKYYKKKLIQQVDVTLQSFMTKDELSAEKIEILMDELD